MAGVVVVSLASLLATGGASAQTSAPPAPVASPTAAAQPKHSAKASRYRPDRFAGRAGTYYKMVWGVDSLAVKWGESGEVIRFTYRVLDADKAKVLNDKKFEPSLIDPQAGVNTYFPSIEIASNGDLGMTFMQSSAAEFASMYVTGKTSSDPAGAMRAATLAKAGAATYKASDCFSGSSCACARSSILPRKSTGITRRSCRRPPNG